jgi:Rieske 2Fe-2S family protein
MIKRAIRAFLTPLKHNAIRPFTSTTRGLPGPFYTSDTVYDLDINHIFHKSWLFAGHTCEIPNSGDWITYQAGKYPLVLVRKQDGDIAGYHNVCRHRGMKICKEDKGTSKRNLVCCYHQWSYDINTGGLKFARDLPSSLKTEDLNLRHVNVKTEGGLIFTSVAEEPPCFSDLSSALRRYLSPFGLEHASVAFQSSIIEEGNWKLVFENYSECSHCKVSHPELSVSYPEGINASADEVEDDSFREKCEKAGYPSRFYQSVDNSFRFVRIRLKNDVRSMTLSGEPAVKLHFGNIKDEYLGGLVFKQFPGMWAHFMPDHCITFKVIPLSSNKTQLVTTWLVPNGAQASRDYCLDDLTKVWLCTNAQDKLLVEGVHLGVSSPAYEPGVLLPEKESGVAEFLDWYKKMRSPY